MGKGCVFADTSPGTSLGRNRTFLDRPQRLSRDPVEDKEEAVLRGERHRIHGLAVVLHRHQLGGGVGIVVPHIVVNGLVMPEVLARAGVQRQQTIGVKIIAWAIAAIEFVLRGGYREIRDAALLIDA